eukprot:3689288-Heterocapsa_arctica.AAC.1
MAIPTHGAADGAASGNGQRQWMYPWPAVSAEESSTPPVAGSVPPAPMRGNSAATVWPLCGRRVHGSLARTATAGVMPPRKTDAS